MKKGYATMCHRSETAVNSRLEEARRDQARCRMHSSETFMDAVTAPLSPGQRRGTELTELMELMELAG